MPLPHTPIDDGGSSPEPLTTPPVARTGPFVDAATVEHLAKLSALFLTKEEASLLAKDLDAILGYVGELQSVDVSSVEADDSPAGALRADVPHEGLTREEALAAAPRASETGFAVPGFVGTGARGQK